MIGAKKRKEKMEQKKIQVIEKRMNREEMLKKYDAMFYKWAHRYPFQWQEIEDSVQDIRIEALRLYEKFKWNKGQSKFFTFLYKSIGNFMKQSIIAKSYCKKDIQCEQCGSNECHVIKNKKKGNIIKCLKCGFSRKQKKKDNKNKKANWYLRAGYNSKFQVIGPKIDNLFYSSNVDVPNLSPKESLCDNDYSKILKYEKVFEGITTITKREVKSLSSPVFRCVEVKKYKMFLKLDTNWERADIQEIIGSINQHLDIQGKHVFNGLLMGSSKERIKNIIRNDLVKSMTIQGVQNIIQKKIRPIVLKEFIKRFPLRNKTITKLAKKCNMNPKILIKI